MLYLYVYFHLLHVVSLLTVYAVECSFVAAVTLTFMVANQSWHTGPNETVLHFQVVFVISWTSNRGVSISHFLDSFTNFA